MLERIKKQNLHMIKLRQVMIAMNYSKIPQFSKKALLDFRI
jgi:hypothetical protein